MLASAAVCFLAMCQIHHRDCHSASNTDDCVPCVVQDLETSFCPEIGDATVGSLVVTTSKDSSIDGPGYLSALVNEVTYVDEVSTPGRAVS